MDEKLQQFIGLKLVAATFTDGVLVCQFDDDGDPNTDGTLTLTVADVKEDDIRCD